VIKLCSNKFDESLRKFVERKYIEDIDEDHLVFFVMFFVEKYCQSIYGSLESKELGRPRLPAKNMLCLIIYGHMIKMLSPVKIAEFTKTDSVFKLIMEGISVSRSSVIRYRDYYLDYYPEILSKLFYLDGIII
jgi:transposase